MKTMTKIGGLLAAMTMTAAGTAFAAGPQWTYVQGEYARGDSCCNLDTDALGITGSFGFADMWHIQANFTSGQSSDEDYDQWSVTAGAHPAINDSTDAVLDLTFGNVDPDNAKDTDFWALGFGLRTMFTDKLELNGKVAWTYVDDDGTVAGDSAEDLGGQLGAQYNWTPQLSTGLTYVINSDSDALGVNIRFAFD